MDLAKNEMQDGQTAVAIGNFLAEFQNIELHGPPQTPNAHHSVFVHPPYMMQSVRLIENVQQFARLAERHQLRLQRVKTARDNANDETKQFLHAQFYDENNQEKLLANGRATLAEIKQLLQEAVDQKIIPWSEDRRAYRAWLKTYGLGIDCSGFVEQALQRLVEIRYGERELEQIPKVPFLRSGWVCQSILGQTERENGKFDVVLRPFQAKPGDILVNQHHMRIIINTHFLDDAIIFEAAESTSATDIPAGQTEEENDIGPRRILLNYPHPDLPITKQTPLKRRVIDPQFAPDADEKTYLIGRYQLLNREG